MAENKLTDKRLRSLKPGGREQLIGDGGGLWVRVLPSVKGGAVNFSYRFQIGGKERRFNCGTYPETTLALARDKPQYCQATRRARAGPDPERGH